MERSFSIIEHSRNIHEIKIPTARKKDWEQWIMLSSDRHHDNKHCLQDLELQHLKEAREKKAIIIDNGDLHCAMQGKFDKRSTLNDLRDEYKGANYLDLLVDEASKFYTPFAENFAIMGRGNHEASIYDRHGTDLTARTADKISATSGHRVFTSGYTGFVVFRFLRADGDIVDSATLWHCHGYGGGGPVTKDIVQTARQAVYQPDADIILSGHTHDRFIFPITRMRISQSCKIMKTEQLHIKAPSYKDEYGDGFGGWAVGKGHPPKPAGCVWLRFFYDSITEKIKYTAFLS